MTNTETDTGSVDTHIDEKNIGWLTINRPKFRNAISQKMWIAIPEKLDQLRVDGARAIIISGASSTFASGADLHELDLIDNYSKAQTFWYAIREALNYVYAFELPTIAMIDGPCIGGGLLLAIACDIRWSSNEATFGVPVAKLGIVLDDENIARLTHLVGPAMAKLMLFTGDNISSKEAYDVGLVNKLESPNELRNSVEKITRRIVGNGYGSIIESKRSVRRATDSGNTALLPQHETVVVSSYLTSDFRSRIKQSLVNNE